MRSACRVPQPPVADSAEPTARPPHAGRVAVTAPAEQGGRGRHADHPHPEPDDNAVSVRLYRTRSSASVNSRPRTARPPEPIDALEEPSPAGFCFPGRAGRFAATPVRPLPPELLRRPASHIPLDTPNVQFTERA
jgi:hypothetical protein